MSILINIKRLFCLHNFVSHFVVVHDFQITGIDGGKRITESTGSLGYKMRRCLKCGLMEYGDE